ncbi:MAG: MerR family transcriptional regulator [Desulfovibrio sp.]
MTTKKLLSVAEISRQLDVPESTVHYWKNRFAQYLPSVGQNRQKRFKPEAVEVFAVIARMLKEGHTAKDVMDHLAATCAITPQAAEFSGQADQMPLAQVPALNALGPDQFMQIAQAVGLEIGRSLSEVLRTLPLGQGSGQAAGDDDPGNGRHDPNQTEEDMLMVRTELDRTCALVEGQHEELSELRQENAVLRQKLEVMEGELVRLRKDRRELEKYLLDKIRKVTT